MTHMTHNNRTTLFVNAYGDYIQTAVIAQSTARESTNGNNTLLLAEKILPVSRNMTTTFLPMIKDTLSTANTPLTQLHRIIVVNGPGSYTGLRIAMASLLGISDALNITMRGISTNDAFALSSNLTTLRVAVGERFGYVVRRYNFASCNTGRTHTKSPHTMASDYSLVDKATLTQQEGSSTPLIIDENSASKPRRHSQPNANDNANASENTELSSTTPQHKIIPLLIVAHPCLNSLLVAPTPFYSITNPYNPPQNAHPRTQQP